MEINTKTATVRIYRAAILHWKIEGGMAVSQ